MLNFETRLRLCLTRIGIFSHMQTLWLCRRGVQSNVDRKCGHICNWRWYSHRFFSFCILTFVHDSRSRHCMVIITWLYCFTIFVCVFFSQNFRWLRSVNVVWSHNWFQWICRWRVSIFGLFRCFYFILPLTNGKMANGDDPGLNPTSFTTPRSKRSNDHKRLQHSWEIALKRVCKVNGHRNTTQPVDSRKTSLRLHACLHFILLFLAKFDVALSDCMHETCMQTFFKAKPSRFHFIYDPKAARDWEFSASHRRKKWEYSEDGSLTSDDEQ